MTYQSLLVSPDNKTIWFDKVDSVKEHYAMLNEDGTLMIELTGKKVVPNLRIVFVGWECDRTTTFVGAHLIHKPSKQKFDLVLFNSSAHLVSGDLIHVTFETHAIPRKQV